MEGGRDQAVDRRRWSRTRPSHGRGANERRVQGDGRGLGGFCAASRRTRGFVAVRLSHEGAGRVVLEANAAGVPVIVSRAGGLPQAVDEGVTGIVVSTTDIPGWTEAVERLEEDAEPERMGKAAWDLWAKHYTPEEGLAQIKD
jgi:glycosyltransferase involved in cell wall biosynthesis